MNVFTLTKQYDIAMSNAENEDDRFPQYGTLTVLGMNGRPDGTRVNRLKIELTEPESHYGIRTALIDARIAKESDKTDNDPANQATIRLEKNGADVVVPFVRSKDARMYQLGRSSSKAIDFFVDAPKPYAVPVVSRFACRILVEARADHHEPVARIYAAAFDEEQKIFIGEHASTLIERIDGSLDSFTSNGVLVLRPRGGQVAFSGEDLSWTNEWREVSIFGRLFKVKEARNRPTKEDEMVDEENTLVDGTVIDLGGVTLFWRTSLPPVSETWLKEAFINNKLRKLVSCEGSKATLIFNEKNCHPCVYTGCGHVVTATRDGTGAPQPPTMCAVAACRKPGKLIQLQQTVEPYLFIDGGNIDYCFNPCGHLVNETTAKFWANVAFRTATNGVTLCPFCAKPLVDDSDKKFIKLVITELPPEMPSDYDGEDES